MIRYPLALVGQLAPPQAPGVPAWLQAVILGIVQGLTEFLPVSSSGHLVLAQALFGENFEFAEAPVVFDLVLHVGTLLPVLYFYRADLLRIVQSFFDFEDLGELGPLPWLRASEMRWLGTLVVVGTVPTAVIGILFKERFETLFHDPKAVCTALFVTGALLLATRWLAPSGGRSLTVPMALLIGLVQGFAITPGISRSGSTIAVALLLGIERDRAARFSFLLSIPAIMGAVVLSLKDGVTLPEGSLPSLTAGFLVSMVVGYAALVMLVALVRRGGLHHFTLYLWPVAVIGLYLTW